MVQYSYDNSDLSTNTYEDLLGSIAAGKQRRMTIDNFSNWYIFNGEVLMGIPLMRKYENILRAGLIDYDIAKDRYYRPEYVSNDLYGTTDYWYLLLFLNNMKSIDDFNRPTIKVFQDGTLQNLNEIYLQEFDLTSRRGNPRIVNKSIMRDLNTPSKRLIKDNATDTVDWQNTPNYKNSVSDLLGHKFNKYTYTITKGYLVNKDGENVPPLTLNSKGLFNVPSVYYQNGYYQKLTGKVKLDANTKYAFIKAYNGWCDVQLTNADDSSLVYNPVSNEEYQLGENKLIMDFRRTTTEDTNIAADPSVTFDPTIGRYSDSNNSNFNSQTTLGMEFQDYMYDNSGPYFSEHFEYNNIGRRLDLSRIDDKEFLTFNLEYSSLMDEKTLSAIDATSYRITIKYDDNTTQQENAYVNGETNIYHTQGNRSFLKFSMINKNYKTKKIKAIQFDVIFSYKPNKTKDDIGQFEYNVYSLGVSSQPRYLYQNVFSVDKSGWYRIAIKYVYSYNGMQTLQGINMPEQYNFNKIDLAGIYFNPTIAQLNDDMTINDNDIEYTTDSYEEHLDTGILLPSGTDTITIDDGNPTYNTLTNLYTTDLSLPDEYVMVLRLKHNSITTGGGVGFSFDYQDTNKTGYMIWITSDHDNINLPVYNKYDQWDISPSGIYELDKQNSDFYPIFEGDNDLYLNMTNQLYYDTNGLVIKIVKKFNRLRMFVRRSDNIDDYDYYTPFFSLLDTQDIPLNGGISFLSVFSSLKCEILEYYPYNTVNNND